MVNEISKHRGSETGHDKNVATKRSDLMSTFKNN